MAEILANESRFRTGHSSLSPAEAGKTILRRARRTAADVFAGRGAVSLGVTAKPRQPGL